MPWLLNLAMVGIMYLQVGLLFGMIFAWYYVFKSQYKQAFLSLFLTLIWPYHVWKLLRRAQ